MDEGEARLRRIVCAPCPSTASLLLLIVWDTRKQMYKEKFQEWGFVKRLPRKITGKLLRIADERKPKDTVFSLNGKDWTAGQLRKKHGRGGKRVGHASYGRQNHWNEQTWKPARQLTLTALSSVPPPTFQSTGERQLRVYPRPPRVHSAGSCQTGPCSASAHRYQFAPILPCSGTGGIPKCRQPAGYPTALGVPW